NGVGEVAFVVDDENADGHGTDRNGTGVVPALTSPQHRSAYRSRYAEPTRWYRHRAGRCARRHDDRPPDLPGWRGCPGVLRLPGRTVCLHLRGVDGLHAGTPRATHRARAVPDRVALRTRPAHRGGVRGARDHRTLHGL